MGQVTPNGGGSTNDLCKVDHDSSPILVKTVARCSMTTEKTDQVEECKDEKFKILEDQIDEFKKKILQSY